MLLNKYRSILCRVAPLLALTACGAADSSGDASDAEQAASSLTITAPARVRVGDVATITGHGFRRNEYVSTSLATVTGRSNAIGAACVAAKADGSIAVSGAIPAADAGSNQVVVQAYRDSACKRPVKLRSAKTAVLVLPAASSDPTTWPNTVSAANSDAWLVAHHDTLQSMHPRLLVIRYGNDQSDDARFRADIATQMLEVSEGTRFHGYSDPSAPAFLSHALVKTVDLRDATSFPDKNSGKWPFSSVDTSRPYRRGLVDLFSADYAKYLDFFDPAINRYLTLGELYQQGIVNEVWFYGNQFDAYDAPDGTHYDHYDNLIFETNELKQMYDASFQKRADLASAGGRYVCGSAGCFDACAGNGCMDLGLAAQLAAQNGVSMRLGFINEHRVGGPFMESLGHTIEGTAGHGALDPSWTAVPYFTENFVPFANFDLGTRFATPWSNMYAAPHCDAAHDPSCTTFFDYVDASGTPSDNSLTWKNKTTGQTIVMSPWNGRCGAAHFPPNATTDYEFMSARTVLSACETYGTATAGPDELRPYNFARLDYLKAFFQGLPVAADFTVDSDAADAAWEIYWRQSMPGLGNQAHDVRGGAMKNWWPFFYY